MKKSTVTTLVIFGVIAVVLLLNSINREVCSRCFVDLTQDRLYSLSDGTGNILGTMTDPITLKFYYSKTDSAKLPGLKLYGERILDLLRQYERLGNGNIILEVYDPRPDSDDEEWAEKYGLTPIPSRTGEQLYLGLVGVNSEGNEQSLPDFKFNRQEFLEYDISKLISTLMHPKKPIVALLSSIDVAGAPGSFMGQQQGGDDGWFFVTQLQEQLDVKFLQTGTDTIEKDVDVLIVLHPKNLSEQTRYAIDQFVMRGGNLIVFEDPYCQADNPPADPNNPMAGMMAERSSSLNSVLSKWGVELVEKKVVGDLELAAKVNTGRGDIKPFVLWPALRPENLNRTDISTSALENAVLPWPGSLKISKLDGVEIETLMHSSKQSQLVDEQQFRFNGGDPDALIRTFSPQNEELTLAARIHGKLKSNFPDGPPKKTDEKPEDLKARQNEHLNESKGAANVVVVADVDFLSDRYSVAVQTVFGTKVAQLLNDNLNFFQNTVENLLGSNDLISIRSRGRFTRPFTVVDKLEADAQQHWQIEEGVFQAKLNNANQRLAQLQTTVSGQGSERQVFNKAVMDEIQKLREEKRDAQGRLREIRRNLRQDIEQLGEVLFLLNTFLVPLILVLWTVLRRASRRRNHA